MILHIWNLFIIAVGLVKKQQHVKCQKIWRISPYGECGPLNFPSQKSFLLFFAYEKGLGHMFQK